MKNKRTALTAEQIAELHQFQIQKQFGLIRAGMMLGITPWTNKITITSKVRKLKTEI